MATKQLNVRISDPGWGKMDRLTELYGSKTRVIELAIDRLYHSEVQEETGMDEYISITVTGDELFGNWQNTELYDEDQSVLEYTEQLCAALAEVFRCSIEVVPGDVGKIELGIDNSDDRPRVHQIVGEVYESYRWVRYTRAGIAENIEQDFWFQREDGIVVATAEFETDAGVVYKLLYHRDGLPAHDWTDADSKEALLDLMQAVAPFEHWNPSE